MEKQIHATNIFKNAPVTFLKYIFVPKILVLIVLFWSNIHGKCTKYGTLSEKALVSYFVLVPGLQIRGNEGIIKTII